MLFAVCQAALWAKILWAKGFRNSISYLGSGTCWAD
jgi:hypothetical protein